MTTGLVILTLFAAFLIFAQRRSYARLPVSASGWNIPWRDLLAVAVLGLLLVALQPVPQATPTQRQSPQVALVVDVSASMAATDAAPSRLEEARREILALISSLPQVRFALIPFAGEAMVQVPLSTDHEALLFFAERLTPGMVAAPGSAPEEAVLLARQNLATDGGEGLVLLFSDGERTVSNPPPRLGPGIPVSVVPLGNAKGGTIPDADGDPRRDRHGDTIITRPDLERLARLARDSGGTVLTAARGQTAVAPLIARWRNLAAPQSPPTTPLLWGALTLLLLRQLPHRRTAALVLPALLVTLVLAACGDRRHGEGELLFNEALLLYHNRDSDEAAGRFLQAAGRLEGPSRGIALYNYATLRLAAADAEHAVPALEQALLLIPGDDAVRTNLVLALRALGDRAPAGLGEGERPSEGPGDSPIDREQALQLVETVRPQPFAPSVSSETVREKPVEKDW